jgi:hypothetical protein
VLPDYSMLKLLLCHMPQLRAQSVLQGHCCNSAVQSLALGDSVGGVGMSAGVAGYFVCFAGCVMWACLVGGEKQRVDVCRR